MTDTSGALTPEQIADIKKRRDEALGGASRPAGPSPQFQYERNMALETDAPDDAAYDLKKSQELGIPREAIAGAREEYRAEDVLRQMEIARKAAPKTTAWMQEPDNYAVSRDDTNTLSAMEKLAASYTEIISLGGWKKSLTALGPATEKAVAGIAYSSLNTPGLTPIDAALIAERDKIKGLDEAGKFAEKAAGAVKVPSVNTSGFRNPFKKSPFTAGKTDDVVNYAGALLSEARTRAVENSRADAISAEKRFNEAMPKSMFGIPEVDAIYSGIHSAGAMVPAMAAGFLTRSAGVPMAIMGRQVYGMETARGLEEGLDDGGLALFAGSMSGIERVTEFLGLKILFGGKPGQDIIKRGVASLLTEQVQEQVATASQDFVDWQILNPDKTFDQFIAERPMAAYQTMIATMVASGMTNTAVLTAEYAATQFAQDQLAGMKSPGEETLTRLIGEAGKSKLRGRSPTQFEGLAAQQLEGTASETTVIDLDGLAQSLGEAGMNVADAMAELGIPDDAFSESAIVMGSIEIPTAKLLAAKGLHDHVDKVQPHIRLKGEDLTPFQKTELQNIAELAKRYTTELKEDVARDATKLGAFMDVQEQIYTAIKGGGLNLTEEQLRHSANVEATRFAYVAMKRGQDVRDTFAEIGPKFAGQAAEASTPVLKQAEEAGYQGTDRGEAESWLRGVEKGLDMSQAGRMGRMAAWQAEENTDPEIAETVFYRGQRQPVEGDGFLGTLTPGFEEQGVGVSLTIDADAAEAYGSNIYPVYVRGKFASESEFVARVNAIFESEGAGSRSAAARVRAEMQAEGYVGLKADGGGMLDSGEIRVWMDQDGNDPSNIRSVHAAFDPDQSGSSDLLAQSIRQAARMPMAEVKQWVINNVTSTESDFPNGDVLTVMKFPLTEDPDAPEVMVSIRLKADGQNQSGRADVNLFLDNQMADALENVESQTERGALAKIMFAKTVMVMRQYAAEYDVKAFHFVAAENQATPAKKKVTKSKPEKSKSREALYRLMLSTMSFEGYTGYEIDNQMSVVRTEGDVKSADPLFPTKGFVVVKDGVNVEEFARNEIIRGSQRGGDAGEVVTVLTATRLGRADTGDRGGRGRGGAGEADPGGVREGAENLTQPLRGGYDPSTRQMTFSADADASTLLHENSHWFLSTLEELAPTEKWAADDLAEINSWYQSIRNTPKMAEIRARYSVVPDPAGGLRVMYQPPANMIGEAQPAMRLERVATIEEGQAKIEWRERQEAWAETTEEYFMTGEAPTPRLKQILRDFKKWLLQIYNGMLPGERANLTPEIKSMMDRILAVDVEVDAASAEVFRDARQMADEMLGKGIITPRQHKLVGDRLDKAREQVKEELLARVMQEKLKAGEASRQIERTRVLGDLARAFDKSEVGRAVNWLAYGEWKGDLPNEPGTMSPEEADARSNEEVFQPRIEVVSEAQAVAAREFDGEVDRIFEDSEFKWSMLDDEMERIMAPLDAKLAEFEAVDVVQMAQDESDKFYNEGVEALDPEDENYDDDLTFLEDQSVLVYEQAYERIEAETEAQIAPIQEERDGLADSEETRLQEDAERQIEEYRDRAITELVDRFEAAYGAAALLSTKYEEYSGYDKRDRFVLNSDGQLLPIEEFFGDEGEVLPQAAYSDETLGQTAPTFYSALGRFLETSKTAKAPAAQWKGMITNAPGIKAEEVEWTGVMEWLDLQSGSVTREAVAEFVAGNGVAVEEVTKSSGNASELEALREDGQRLLLPLIEERSRVQERYDNEESDPEGPDFAALAEIERELDGLTRQIGELESLYGFNDLPADDTKWSAHTLPGGENYTELLLTLPVKSSMKPRWRVINKNGEEGSFFPNRDDAERLASAIGGTVVQMEDTPLEEGVYTSSHWSEPNVLAHVRFKERAGPNGERVLALEEIQSDWHQAGRERGYKDPLTPEEKEYETLNKMRNDGFVLFPNEEARMAELKAQGADVSLRAKINGVPNAPFKNNAWTELVLKRMIRHASENGFDAVAWIPGNIQNGQVVNTDDNRGDFYDKIVPNAANKIGKKFGARVGQINFEDAALPDEDNFVVRGNERDGFIVQNKQRSTVAEGFKYEEDAYSWIGENEVSRGVKFHSLLITPELRAAAMEQGFPLFQTRTFNPPGHGAIAPPTNISPIRLDLKLVRDLYGDEALRKLPAAVRRRSSTSSNVTDMLQQIEAARKVLSQKRKGPQTLTQFIMQRQVKQQDGSKRNRQWGIKGAAADLKAMGLEKLINEKSGMPIDAMRELAEEAGFIRAEAGGARNTEYGDFDGTPNDLLDALAREAKGENVVRIGEEVDNKELDDAKTWASWLDQNGVDIYETDKKKLKASVDQMLRDTDEMLVSPDQAAEMFGFNNGEELLAALAQVGNRDAFLNKMADQKMVEEFGDMMTDGTLQAEAAEAARLDIAHRQTEIELEALARAVGQQASANYAKSLAKDIIALRTVKEIAAYERDLNNERQFAKQALRLVEKGDYPGALKAKQRQLVSMQLYTEGKKANERIEKQRRDLLKYLTSEGRREKIAGDYLERIDAVLDDFELRVSKQAPSVQKARQSAAAYVAWMTEQGREAEIAPEAMLLATQANLKTWRNLTGDEVDYLVGTIENMAHLGRTKQRLLNDKEKREFRAVVAEIVGVLEAAPSTRKRGKSFSPGLAEDATIKLSKYDAKLTKIPDEFEWLDGKQAGPLATSILLPIEQADVRKMTMIRAATKEVRKLWNAIPPNMRKALVNKRVSTPELPLPRGDTMTMMDVVLIGFNYGNAGNREALLAGYGWEAANVEAVLNRYLTDAHWDFITGMWSLIGSYRDDAFALQKRMTGTAPKAVEGITFTLASGRKIQGAYFPLKYDGDQESALAVKQQKLDEKQMMAEMGFSFTKPMTRTGHMIERVGSGGKPVKMSIDVLYEHVENVIHDIAFRPAVIDAFKIIRDPAFTSAYIAAAGKVQYDRLMPWLHSIATNNRTRFSTTFSKMMTSMRGRWSVTIMGFSIRTATQQMTGYMEAATEIGPRWVMQGALKTLGAGPSSFWREWAFIRERSEYLANRVAIGKERDIRSVMSSVKPGGVLAPVRENAFIFLSMMDAIIGTGVWRGAFDKAQAGRVPGIDPTDEEAAIAYADRSVQRSLSSGETYQLPEIMREGEISALMTMVYSYGSKTYNRQRLRNMKLRYGQMDLATYTASTFIAFMAVPIIAALLAGRLWPDDEDEWEDRADDVGMEILMNAAGTAPFVRDMVSFLSRPEYGFQLSPVQSTFEQIGGAARDAAEGKTLDSQYRTKQAVFAVATVFGLPGNQLWTTGDYVYDVIMGNEDPTEEPVDAAREALIRDTR